MAKVFTIRSDKHLDKMLTELKEKLGYKKVDSLRQGVRLLYKQEMEELRKINKIEK